MFDFAWSEIALIGVVALIFIGPKDLPIAIKAVSGAIKKARRMAGEFQTHVDEMVKDADLAEVRQSVNEIRNFDWKGTIERAVDSDGNLRGSFSNPLTGSPASPPAVHPLDQVHIDAARRHAEDLPPPAPAFVPPDASAPAATEAAAAPAGPPPAFIPPDAAHRA